MAVPSLRQQSHCFCVIDLVFRQAITRGPIFLRTHDIAVGWRQTWELIHCAPSSIGRTKKHCCWVAAGLGADSDSAALPLGDLPQRRCAAAVPCGAGCLGQVRTPPPLRTQDGGPGHWPGCPCGGIPSSPLISLATDQGDSIFSRGTMVLVYLTEVPMH